MAGALTTVTPSWAKGQNVRRIHCHWLCDDATGEPLDAVTPPLGGWVERITWKVTGGLTTAPANGATDLVITDDDGAVLPTGVVFVDMLNANTYTWIPDVPYYVWGAMRIRVTGTAVNEAQFDVYVYVSK